ncbi:hypothetical protein F4820DRAFT_451719 [Hypoxylon rubiginosum]|uniref:Uncharacterized protein n=1 Tax=Hypoxylon rubiginosum TaxID=110542 RepID=A0ACB9YRL9_9PEZI|nr:hypothetical protein F4820DRAFT_451719 [Hypoxylon rubiginosum]
MSLPLLPIAATVAVATVCAAISLAMPPPALYLNAADPLLPRQDRTDWQSLRVVAPSPGDLLVAFWALFWRVPTRLITRAVGFFLGGVVGDANDLWLSTEL